MDTEISKHGREIEQIKRKERELSKRVEEIERVHGLDIEAEMGA